jgi:hypothetical protein
VPGYNTAIEVETLERRALAYQPDLVILNFVDNDLSLPNFIVMERSYLTLAHSFFLDFVLTRLRGKTAAEEPELRQLPRAARRVRFDDDPRWVPERYRDMVGRPAFRNGLERLKRLSLQHHFAVLVLGHPQARDFVAEACRDLDLDLVETYPALEAFGARHDQAQREALVLGPQDPHPSALGHDLIAGVLVEHLQSSGLLQRLAE